MSVRPSLESLEGRVVPSAASFLSKPVFDVPAISSALHGSAVQQSFSMLPMSITGISLQNGQLVATGLLGGTAFTTPVDLIPSKANKGVTILDLHLAPIHLDVLGLHVDTSSICLSIRAKPGPGNLLGNLLSDVANALNSGGNLDGILSGLNLTQRTTLLDSLTTIADTAIHDLTQSTSVSSASTNILNLSLGPVHLNILGLHVKLDNCANGPVTLSITATPGAGNLLGNLLTDLAHALDNHNLSQISTLEGEIASIVGSIL